MSTTRWQRYSGATAIVLTLALLGGTDGAESFKGPTYILVRGGGIETPVVVHHGPRVEGWNPAEGPLMRLVMSFSTVRAPVPDPETSRYYEVFEFWGVQGLPAAGPDGMPVEPLDLATAATVSRIYPDEPGGPVWNRSTTLRSLSGPPTPSTEPYRRIPGTGLGVLRAAGLPL